MFNQIIVGRRFLDAAKAIEITVSRREKLVPKRYKSRSCVVIGAPCNTAATPPTTMNSTS
jgi:hypothetical protein